ncbi:hypothetical protein [Blastococcus goldschmidtiae]|uniref:Uncharacterized protein n=1 Tax=Blastococcus goldschmidtiae TaxID=3075546 RepID=A0ABU2KCV0_9ACTN|nr:hypothetical protein [Blastococcus sp. DSM 46792]MDT0277992.1 hypothetical protein [Blastococcus sp. DSM 46792]
MHPLAAAPASAADDRALVPLWTIDDLQDADLDLVLADRLAESAVALRAAAASAAQSLRGAPGYLLAG